MLKDNQLLEEIKNMWDKKPPETIRKEMGLSHSVFGYLVGKANLNWDRQRIQTITTVKWTKQIEKGNEYYIPNLQVSRRIVRILDLKDGVKVKWSIKKEKIIGEIL